MLGPKKIFGQNFLSSAAIAYRMIELCELKSEDNVIEIGPGLGFITSKLVGLQSKIGFTLEAVEIDERFVEYISKEILQTDKFKLIHANILDYLRELDRQNVYYSKIIGSIPYNITSPIIHGIIRLEKLPKICVLMIQKEVAKKIVNEAPNSSYLSNYIKTFYDVKYCETVDSDKFYPVPEVQSAVIRLTYKESLIPHTEKQKYQGFLHKGFSSPRKMLNKSFRKDELEIAGISPNKRPQEIDFEKWVDFYNKVKMLENTKL